MSLHAGFGPRMALTLKDTLDEPEIIHFSIDAVQGICDVVA